MAPSTRGTSKEKKPKQTETKSSLETRKNKSKAEKTDTVEEKTRKATEVKSKGPADGASRSKSSEKPNKVEEERKVDARSGEEVSNKSKKKRARDEQESHVEEVPSLKRRKADDTLDVKKASSKKHKETSLSGSEHSPDEDEVRSEQEAGEEVYLHGFSTDEDSSDDDGIDVDPLDVSKLPNAARDDKSVKSKLDRAKKKQAEERGVLYLGRIPHGFYEDQMKEYFSQFGNVTRLRISRNKKTGKSKHYGFIEFDSASVAKIVSETMDNYLLSGHLLQCKVIPPEQVHPELWVGANKKWKKLPTAKLERISFNKERTVEEKGRAEERLLKRQKERAEKIKAAGIKYSLDKVGYKPAKP